MKTSIIAAFLLGLTCCAHAGAEQGRGMAVKDKYRVVQVELFDLKEGASFPAESLPALQDQILRRLQESKEFQEVLRPDQNPTQAEATVLRLTGTITGYKAGSRAKRYFVGFGAGSAQLFAHLRLLDRATGQVVINQDIRGRREGGAFGGASMKVVEDFARQVVSALVLRMAAKAPEETGGGVEASVPESAPDQHTLTISSDDFAGAEQKLGEEGAAGYRLIEFTRTGPKTVELILQRSTAASTYQYRVLRAYLAGTLQGNLNKAAADGYRLCPDTLEMFGATLVVLVEKAPASPQTPYNYRVHLTLRLSSAQKDIHKDEVDGYTLADAIEISGGHILILERGGVHPGA